MSFKQIKENIKWKLVLLSVIMINKINGNQFVLQALNYGFGGWGFKICPTQSSCGTTITRGYASEWTKDDLSNINFLWVRTHNFYYDDEFFGHIYIWDNKDCSCDSNNNCHVGRNIDTPCIIKVKPESIIDINPFLQIYMRSFSVMRICKNSEECGASITYGFASEWNNNQVNEGDILWWQMCFNGKYPTDCSLSETHGGIWIWNNDVCECNDGLNCNVGLQKICILKIV